MTPLSPSHPRVVPAASLKPEEQRDVPSGPGESSAGSPRGLIEALPPSVVQGAGDCVIRG